MRITDFQIEYLTQLLSCLTIYNNLEIPREATICISDTICICVDDEPFCQPPSLTYDCSDGKIYFSIFTLHRKNRTLVLFIYFCTFGYVFFEQQS